jgi:RNA polymerase sigma factor (sigma-70 family)
LLLCHGDPKGLPVSGLVPLTSLWPVVVRHATFSPSKTRCTNRFSHYLTPRGTQHEGFTSRYPRPQAMSAPQALVVDPERTFLDNLATIDRVIGVITRRHSLGAADAEEFASWVRARLIDGNYAAIRKFGGRSSLATYLSVVIGNLFLDYRNSIWGRWRPSAAALRLGPLGIRIEELLYREGHSLREAIGVLQSAGVTLTDAEVSRLAAKIPPREKTSEVPLEKADSAGIIDLRPNAPAPEESEVAAAIRAALEQLPSEEQVIVRMRFWDDLTVADIARALRIEQKPLYRKLEGIQKHLRAALTARGIDDERVADVLAGESLW